MRIWSVSDKDSNLDLACTAIPCPPLPPSHPVLRLLHSKQSSPIFKSSQAFNQDELDPSEDELPDTISGIRVKKEKDTTPMSPLIPTPGSGRGTSSPINLISDSESDAEGTYQNPLLLSTESEDRKCRRRHEGRRTI